MHSNLAISRTPPLSGIPMEMTAQRPRALNLVDNNNVEIYLKRDTHQIQRHSRISTRGNLRNTWVKLESHSNSCSLGMVCRSGPRRQDLSGLLHDGFSGMPLPGAIAIIGCDLDLLDNLTKLCRSQARPYRIKTISRAWVPLELPPMLMLVDAGDRSIVQAMKTAEELQTLDLEIEIAISPDSDDEHRGLNDRIRRFFETHLIRDFPRKF